ncbi:Sodium-dependent phosphate transporter 1 [Rhizoctonia solani]|uniref:Phosphate transporter n=1 Tax=Rhizoctonia solani TaxID=456999 RepID=A0A8H7LZB3_9AGAM|nr:Sodium-dependent phosphate transporter 1 [Rhizoctonia solani]
MPRLAQYDYLFAFGVIFAFLDAFNIGANDVANSFATSVSSRSLTMRQAVAIASVMEFLGAVLVGARVASTIRNGIIDISIFNQDPAMLLLAMVCAICASSLWLTMATRLSMPVSTTHSISIWFVDRCWHRRRWAKSIKWGWNGNGVAFVFASWVIAPAVAGGFAAIVFLLTKFVVLNRDGDASVKYGLMFAPIYFFVVSGVLTMAILWKGSPSLGLSEMLLARSAVVMLLSIIFWLPYVHARVVKGDYTVRWYHFFMGPLLWRRQPPADAAEFIAGAVPDYYKGHHAEDAVAPADDEEHGAARHLRKDETQQVQSGKSDSITEEKPTGSDRDASEPAPTAPVQEKSRIARLTAVEGPPIEGAWIEPKNLYIIARYRTIPFIVKVFTHGTTVDVLDMQAQGQSKEARRLQDMHNRAAQYDNRTEHLYSFLQVMTAATASYESLFCKARSSVLIILSFAHGSNDVSNAIGPFATIYFTWHTGTFAGSKSPVAVWMLVFGGAAIVIGLATYGYNVYYACPRQPSDLHSPSRGFSMELGASLAVVLASQVAVPVSTTQCITGATLAVGLCNGDLHALNWRMFAWIFFSWVLTIPCAGLLAGCLFGIIANAPRFSS